MSNGQTKQIKVTLSDELYMSLKSNAEKSGLDIESYVIQLIINDIWDVDIPVFKMSPKTEKIGLQALKDHYQGKTTLVEDIDEYFDKLSHG